MAHNNLIYVDKNAFKYCELQTANFGYNQLSFNYEDDSNNSPFQYCNNLGKLDLSYNNISKIFEDWKKFKMLYHLILISNSFKYIQVR